MFRKLLLISLSVILVSCFCVCFQSEAGSNLPLTVTRGGTGISTVTEGQSIWGSSIDHLIATSSMSMNMSTGAVSIGTVVISAVTDGDLTAGGDLFVAGNVGISTTTPAENIVVTGTATTTAFFESTSATQGGELILKDVDAGGCTSISTLNGTVTGKIITCPY